MGSRSSGASIWPPPRPIARDTLVPRRRSWNWPRLRKTHGLGPKERGGHCRMLFQISVHAPSLVMSEIAWWLRVAIALTCLIGLIVVAIGAVGVAYKFRLTLDACRTAKGPSCTA